MTDTFYDIDARRNLLRGMIERDEGSSPPVGYPLDERRELLRNLMAEDAPEEPSVGTAADQQDAGFLGSARNSLKSSGGMTFVADLARENSQKINDEVSAHTSQMQQILGPDNFVAEEGLDDFFLKFDLSRSNKFTEQKKKFLAKYPEGTFAAVPLGSDEMSLVFKRTPDEPLREVSPGRRSPFPTTGTLGTIAGTATSEPVVGGGLGVLFGGPLGGALGATGGVIAQSEIERARGFEDDQRLDVAKRALGEGALSFAVDLAIPGLSRGLPALARGRPSAFFSTRPEAVRGAEAAKELALPEFMIGQTAKSPVVRAAFEQASGTADIGRRKGAERLQALRARIRQEIDDDSLRAMDDANLAGLLNVQDDEIRRILQPFAIQETSKDGAAKALDTGFANFEKTSREWRDRLYERALSKTDDVSFDLSESQALAKEIKDGVVGLGKKGKPVRRSGKPKGELKEVIDDILGSDATISKFRAGDQEFDAFTQIKELRSRLYDLKNSDDPAIAGPAKRLWGALRNSMDSPISGDEAFVRAYRSASAANAFREDRLGLQFVRRILNTNIDELGGAGAVSDRLLSPGEFSALRATKRMVGDENFSVLQNRFKAQLMENPAEIDSVFRSFANDMDQLRLLITSEEQAAFRQYAAQMTNMEKAPLRALYQSDLDLGERAIKFGEKATRKQMADTIERAGVTNSDFAVAIRSGVYQKILDAATVVDKDGVTTINPARVASEIKKVRKNLGGLMSDLDWKKLQNFEAYAAVSNQKLDVGGQMQRAGIVGQVTNFLNPLATLKGFRRMASNQGVARVLASSVSYEQLIAAPSGGIGARKLRAFVNAAVLSTQQGAPIATEFKQSERSLRERVGLQ